MSKIGIIGGSGVYQMDGAKVLKEHNLETPFGKPSDAILEVSLNGNIFYFLARHGRGHNFLPHEVNYRANIFALKSLGVEYVISVSAVGSLQEKFSPKTFVIPDNFIDWTKGKRERTFFGNGIVAHVSAAYPVEKILQNIIYQSCIESNIEAHLGGVYLCIEGPQFSSRAESEMYRKLGGDIIGMTNVPESYLAKEAGIAYATMAMVTDFDCWKEEHCSVDEILEVMKFNNQNAYKALQKIVDKISKKPFQFNKENRVGIMSDLNSLDKEKRDIVEVLLK